ncbi:unnamed protein product [Ectocarpus sp. CCAP 1310/34]|nr:unnamed protein product [Ectocarpus sp. CCAP 1310/34]
MRWGVPAKHRVPSTTFVSGSETASTFQFYAVQRKKVLLTSGNAQSSRGPRPSFP